MIHKQNNNQYYNNSIIHLGWQLSISKEVPGNSLKLQNPQLVYFMSDTDDISFHKINKLGNVSVNEITSPISNRIEKKNKIHNKLIDPLEFKKIKLRRKPELRYISMMMKRTFLHLLQSFQSLIKVWQCR